MIYALMDAVALNAAFPDTFERPGMDELDALQVGDFIKVGVEFDPRSSYHDETRLRRRWEDQVGVATASGIGAERFWLLITAITPDGFEGTVNNELVYTGQHGLKCNDPLQVERRHVLTTMGCRWSNQGGVA